jgi:hypothetical protein
MKNILKSFAVISIISVSIISCADPDSCKEDCDRAGTEECCANDKKGLASEKTSTACCSTDPQKGCCSATAKDGDTQSNHSHEDHGDLNHGHENTGIEHLDGD